MSEKVFRQYGPGLIYGQDTIMCFFDSLSREDLAESDKLTDKLVVQQKGKRENFIDEMKELECLRSRLLEKFIQTLGVTNAHFPKIIEQTLPKLDAPFYILRDVIIPIIEQISAKTPESVPRFLSTMNKFLANNTPAEVWDVPEVSEKVTQWMKFALLIPNADQAEILQLWLNFIKVRAKIEDVLVLATVWFEHKVPSDQLTLIPALLSDIKMELAQSNFADYIVNATSPVSISYSSILLESMKPPQKLSEMPFRKCAAHNGFLYVLDSNPKIGLIKLGTGKCGTILGHTAKTSTEFINREPLSMAFCGDYLLVRFADSAPTSITIIDPNTLKVIGEVQNTDNIPAGLFAAFRDTLYVVYQRTLNSYHFDGKAIEFIKSQEITSDQSDFDFLPADKVKVSTLLTDGIFMTVIFNTGNPDQSQYYSCLIETGTVVSIPSSVEPKLIPFMAFDYKAKSLIKASSWQNAEIYNYSERYDFQILYGKMSEETTDNACLNLLNTIVPSSISKISGDSLNFNRHYVLANVKPVYELVEKCFADERYQVFLEPAITLLAIHLQVVNKAPTITLPLLINIMSNQHLSSETKIVFFKSLLKHGNSELFDSPEKCKLILEKMDVKDITEIFGNGFNDTFAFCISFLTKPFDKVLEYASNNSQKEYPFISNLIFTALRGYYVKHLFSPTVFLPILSIIPKCDSNIITTLVPPLIPLIMKLSELLDSDQCIDIILNLASALMKFTNVSDLRDFAEKHAELREKPQYFTKEIIDETSHPYDNDMRQARPYDFPGAVDITITFDEHTTTESNCDYLQIFKDREMKSEITPKLSGKYSNWHTINTKAQHLTFYFYSDGSVNDWGYKAYITVRYRASRSFASPSSFFDLSYSLFQILSNKAMKLYNESANHYPKFKIPKDVITRTLSIDEKKALREKVKSDVDLTLFDSPVTLPSFYSILDYLVSSKLFDKSLIPLIMAPPDYIATQEPDSKTIYRKIASFLLANDFSELPESQFEFLVEYIKGTTDAYTIADNLIHKALDLLSTKHPEKLIPAGTYIQRAITIGGELIAKEGTNIMTEYLRILSQSYLPLNLTLVQSIIDKSFNLFKSILPAINNLPSLLETAFDSLPSTAPNTPDKTVPFVAFALSLSLMLSPKDISKKAVTKLVLNSLKFLIPNNIILISKVTEKFGIQTTVKESPIIGELLTSIGEHFNMEQPVPTSVDSFNISPSFAIARATIIRRILNPNSISELAPIIEKQDKEALGALLVLSQRYVPPFGSQKVRLLSNNKVVTLIGMDYQSYHFETDKGNHFSIPAMNYNNFIYFNIPFEPILPAHIPPVSIELVNNIQKSAASEDFLYQLFGKCALAEISANTVIPSIENDKKTEKIWPKLPMPISFEQKESQVPAENSNLFSLNQNLLNQKKLALLHVVEDKISHFKKDEDQFLYRLNRESNIVTFKIQQSMTVGFGAQNRIASTEIAPLKIDNKTLNFDFGDLKLQIDSSDMTIGLYGPFKQFYIQSGDKFILTQLFLAAIQNPQPFFLAGQKPELATPAQFPSFLFFSKSNQTFSHVYSVANYQLYSIFDQMNKATQIYEMHFLPTIDTSSAKYIYLEITTSANEMKFSLLNETVRAHVLYSKSYTCNKKESKTYGLFVNFSKQNPYAFITFNGEFINSSAGRINLTQKVSLYVTPKDKPIEATINNGSKPYLFDIDGFLSKFDPTKLPILPPVIDDSNIPIGLSSLVSEVKYPKHFLETGLQYINEHEPALYRFERPIFIPSKSLVTSFAPPDTIPKPIEMLTVNVINDYLNQIQVKSDEIVSLTETMCTTEFQSITALQRMQTSMPQFVSPFLFCKSSERDAIFRTLLTKFRRDQFFENLDLATHYSTALNVISRFTPEQLDSFENIEEFIVHAAVSFGSPNVLTGHYDESFGHAMQSIFKSKPKLLESLALKALDYLLHESKRKSETFIVSNCAKVQIEIGRNTADCLYFRILPHSFITRGGIALHGLDICGRKTCLDLNSQYLFEGSLFALQNVKKEDILYTRLLPIYFNKSPLTFALQMVNFMIDNRETWSLLHNKVLLPLFENCQNGNDIIFPSTYSMWFSKAYMNKTISTEMMIAYSNKVDLYGISHLGDELCNSLLLFSLYCYTNSAGTNMNLVRERTINFLDAMLSIQKNYSLPNNSLLQQNSCYQFMNCYDTRANSFVFTTQPPFQQIPSLMFGSVLNRLSQALISPFGNNLQFLGKIGQLELPVLTMSSYLYLIDSQYKTKEHINLSSLNYHQRERIFRGQQLGGVYLQFDKTIQNDVVTANDKINVTQSMKILSIPVQSSKVDKIEMNEFQVKIQFNKDCENELDLYTFDGLVPNNVDFAQVLKYYKELKASLTIETDSYLISIAQFMLSRNNDIAFILNDKSLQRLFPTISPPALRYRISCHISALKDGIGLSTTYPLLQPSASACYTSNQHQLGAIITNGLSTFSLSNNNNVNDMYSYEAQPIYFNRLKDSLLDNFLSGESLETTFFSKFKQWTEIVPMRVFANAPVKMKGVSIGGEDTNDPIRITKYLRSLEPNLFTSNSNGIKMPIPTATDSQSLYAYQGFGFLLGLRFVSGRSPGCQLSRAVIRAAFGGKITKDDLNETDFKLSDMKQFELQFEAIRIDVELAIPGIANMTPSNAFPRVFQIGPRFKMPFGITNNIPECHDFVFFPYIRKQLQNAISLKDMPQDKSGPSYEKLIKDKLSLLPQ